MTLHPFPPPVAAVAEPIATVTPMVDYPPAFDTYALDWFEKGWEVVPTPYGKKAPFPMGVTGALGRAFTEAEIRQMITGDLTYERAEHAKGPTFTVHWEQRRNLVLRMGHGIIGIDVDMYDGKNGAATLADLEHRAGETFPDTWVITSRDDGVSGIRLYRIPKDTKLADQPSVEMIQRHHRVAVAPGSVHHSGRVYKLLRTETWAESAIIPTYGEIPRLPAALIKVLKARESGNEFNGLIELPEEQVRGWVAEHVAADGRWNQQLATADYDAAWGASGSRNTSVFRALWKSLTRASDGQCSAADAIAWVTEAHRAACESDGARADRIGEEVTRAVGRIVAKILAESVELVSAAPPAKVTAVEIPDSTKGVRWLQQELGTGKLSGVFLRGGRLVHCIGQGEEGFKTQENGHLDFEQVSPLSEGGLQALLTMEFDFAKVDGRSGKPKLTLFPRDAASVIVNAPYGLPNVKTLLGISSVPVLRRDGTVLDTPGYDEATGILYRPDPGMDVKVPEFPTDDDVQGARALIEYMVSEFPFVTDNDRAAFIGCLIRPMLGDLLPDPGKLLLINAKDPGSGKTYLAETIRMIYHGTHGGVFRAGFPSLEDEQRKWVSTVLDTGSGGVVVMDNVRHALGGVVLESLTTHREYSDRRLGANENIHAINDRLWIATGNNIAMRGDMERRGLWCNLDPGVERPQDRTGFSITDYPSWVAGNRGVLLRALLTIVRGWAAAGGQYGVQDSSDSFGQAQRVLRGVLGFAGFSGTFDAAPDNPVMSQDDEALTIFLRQCHQWQSGRESTYWTAGELCQASGFSGAAGVDADVLPGNEDSNGLPNSRKVAIGLKRVAGRKRGGLQLRKTEKTTERGVALWTVQRL